MRGKQILIGVLIAAILATGAGAIVTGIVLSEKENALALIALIVGPAITIITSFTTALMVLVRSLDDKDSGTR